MTTFKAFIMARSGSQRVKNKNMRPFAGSNLLEIKIRQMMRIKSLDGVVVNSNDDEMLNLAKSLGCETVKRDPYYCTDEINPNELYVHLAETFPGDVLVISNTTSPLVTDETFERAIQQFKDNGDAYDSLNTGHLVKDFLWLDGKPLNYDEDKKPRSQDLPDIINLNAAINICSKENLIKNRNYVGKKPYIFMIDELEGTDIDYPLDFEIAEFLYRKLHSGESL